MKYNLFLDDNRQLPLHYESTFGGKWLIAETMEIAMMMIDDLGFPSILSLDHDLGENPLSKRQSNFTGLDFVKWFVNIDLVGERESIGWILDETKFILHSLNPIGFKNMLEYLENYKKFSKKDFEIVKLPYKR